ncbi:hypothetical protein Trichorick_01758 (plasmid) [Candidatus Trichorickettsia mobilis]|uniref:hypothetical protein n=1 Tax=Candidatus Trichorickettsia mobilis TaxID=1346319 RepID=UPI002B263E8B|nr:hypothetical protein [Candidatus Trichorickettsia mobilis]WPY01835.1 hypothetical protein Trichorick_01758 [Candidatus Trichorickettsia mobilis]
MNADDKESETSQINKQLVAELKATRTAIELLRDEMEELHLLIAELFQHIEKKNERDNR